MQRIAIVDPTESTRESLRTLLLGVDFVWLEAECARYEYFFDVISGSMPDLAIVALDADKNRALQMIGQLSVEHPRLPILTISQDHQALLSSLQRGAKYFLTHPIGLEDLLAALRRALGEAGMQDSSQSLGGVSNASGVRSPTASQMIAILGSRGGCGTTTLAVNLAATLADEPGNKVALVDLDMALGDADLAIETIGDPVISIADLARTIDRLDMNILKRALVKHPMRPGEKPDDAALSILRHPMEIADVGLIHEDHVSRILNLLKVSYSHLVIDLSKCLQAIDIQALRMADMVLLTAQLELSSLRNVVRLIHYLSGEEGLADKVRVVMNRVGAESIEEGITIKQAEESIGKPIFWQVPNDSKSVIAARVAGQPMVKHAPKSKAQMAIAGLAQAVSGRPAHGSSSELKAKGGWLFGRR